MRTKRSEARAWDRLSRAERRLLVRLFRAGAGIGGRSHPIPNFGGPETTARRLCRLGLLLPDGDHLFFLNTPVFLRARRRWRLRRAVAGVVVILAILLGLRLVI